MSYMVPGGLKSIEFTAVLSTTANRGMSCPPLNIPWVMCMVGILDSGPLCLEKKDILTHEMKMDFD